MDSIDMHQDQMTFNNQGMIFTIVQKSIRFAKNKPLAVYQERKYLGNYVVAEFHEFKLKNLSTMISLLVFGTNKDYGIHILKQYKIKGMISDNTEFQFCCLSPTGYDKKHEIPSSIEPRQVFTQLDILDFMTKKVPQLEQLIEKLGLTPDEKF